MSYDTLRRAAWLAAMQRGEDDSERYGSIAERVRGLMALGMPEDSALRLMLRGDLAREAREVEAELNREIWHALFKGRNTNA